MTVRIWEKFESRSGTSTSVELGYIVQGTDNDAEVFDVVRANTPLIYDLGLVRGEFRASPIGPELWDVVVPYELPEANKNNKRRSPNAQPKFQFDTTGGKQNVKFSRKTKDVVFDQQQGPNGQQAAPAPPDHKGLIGVNGDNVEGVDVVVPTFRFQETWYFPMIPFEYANRLYRLTGRCNQDRFRDFSSGEVLFLGAQGGQERGKAAEITFFFDCQPNVRNLKIGDLTVPFKAGWDYLWVKWEDAEDTTAKAIVKRPLAAYVEEVYPRANFAELNYIFAKSKARKKEPVSTDVVPTVAGSSEDYFPLPEEDGIVAPGVTVGDL